MFAQPLGEDVLVSGIVAKTAHQLGVVWAGDTDHNFMCANSDPGRLLMDQAHALKGARLFQREVGLF
jgi:hypothetical protein